MTDSTDKQAAGGDSLVDQAVAQGGAYEVLRRRLGEQGQKLQAIAQAINARADAAVAYGRVAELIGLMQEAGLSRIGFITAGPQGAASAPS